MRRAHYLQHVPFEGLGSMAAWLETADYAITGTRLFEGDVLPDARDLDLLIVMGGPMSVKDEAEHSWLVAEKRFVRQTIESGVPVLGVCLGAQLIANAMGAPVYAHTAKEIGWFPVRACATGASMGFEFPLETTVFHWHGETFDLPTGARLLASSEACRNQAFQLGDHVIGLQFHLETTKLQFCGVAQDDMRHRTIRALAQEAQVPVESQVQLCGLQRAGAGAAQGILDVAGKQDVGDPCC